MLPLSAVRVDQPQPHVIELDTGAGLLRQRAVRTGRVARSTAPRRSRSSTPDRRCAGAWPAGRPGARRHASRAALNLYAVTPIMWFTRVSIANPVLATMVMLALVVLGWFSFQA
ncbi:MAG: hypothetical protein U1F21_11635 [Sphaerotilus natans]